MRVAYDKSRNKFRITGINQMIARMIPGAQYDRSTRAYFAPISAAPTLLQSMGQHCDASVTKIAESLTAAEKEVERLKEKGYQGEHPLLMEHQATCLAIAEKMPWYAFFLETGTGKTLLGLSIIREKPYVKWLVVCPKAIIKTAWLDDAAKFYPDMKIIPYNRSLKRTTYREYQLKWGTQQPEQAADVLVCNYESFRIMRDEFLALGVQGVIFDESVKIKNPSASVTKAAIQFADKMVYRYILSGIPAPNSELEYFTQLQVVDPGIFGTNFWRFRSNYFEPLDYFQSKWELKPEMARQFYNSLAKRSIVKRKKDCLDLPELVAVRRNIVLSPSAMKYYREMHRTRVLELLKDGATVIAPNKLAQLMKLRQITSGFIIDNEDTPKMLHKEKLKELLEVLDELGGSQAIIWCNFRNEIERIKEVLGDKAVTAYGDTKDIDSSIDKFKAGEAQYIIANPKTLKYGVTLTNASYAIYYSLSYSYDDFAQSRDRIHRYGQTNKATLIFLLAEGTIDEVLYDVLMQKKTKDEAMKAIIAMGGVM